MGDPAVHDDEEEGEGRFRKRRRTPVRRGFLSRIGAWLLGAIITGIVPLAVALWVRSLAVDYVPMLKQATPAAAAGSAAVVAVSFSFMQFLIVYVLVPLVPGLIVGYLTVSPATRLSQAIDWIRYSSGVQVERQVGQAIQDAAASETRVAGLRALAQFGSPDAIDELGRLATGHPPLLNDPLSFDALASALASLGSQSEPLLQTMWKESGHAGTGSAPAEGRTPADLVLAVYAKLEAIADTAVAYGIAREAAMAQTSSPERRAAAIALMAKCGSRSDVAWLASFLVNQPEPVKQAALDALRHLDARLKKQEAPPAANGPAPAGR
jgi:hypothetical protein